jgi:muramoyltetrapeptide carboxypeptidase
MLKPKFLEKGDKIGIVSPAGKIDEKPILGVKKFLESRGYEVVLSEHVFKEWNQFAGTDDERAASFQKMLDDKEIKAIICSRGGYGSIRIIDKLNFSKFKKNPKWIVGYSDITVFHSYLTNKMNCPSIHAIMPKNYTNSMNAKNSMNSLINILRGDIPTYEMMNHELSRPGKAKGKLIGGNLSILQNLRATDIDMNYRGNILFIEDIGEYLYQIDRMMMNLKYSGVLDKISGLIVGNFTKIKDSETPFGMNVFEIIYEKIKDYKYPVCFDFNAGHELPHLPLIMGSEVTLGIGNTSTVVSFKI